jgi:omega-6 fatty acid desaturase (delta-12 desaturase)
MVCLKTQANSGRAPTTDDIVEPAYPDDVTIAANLQHDVATATPSDETRLGRELLEATRPFAKESIATSWWHVISTFTLMLSALALAALLNWWPLRTGFAMLGVLLMVRAFITYHDFMHGAILRESKIASAFFSIYGALILVPARSWKKSHNHHHGHVGQITTETNGAFPLITTRMWHNASPGQRASYRASRHPLIVVFGYITVFFFSVCLQPLLCDPKKHWDSALSLLAHGGVIALLWVYGGFDMAFFAVLLPMIVSSIFGSYLFFAQHSFKGMKLLPAESWTFYRAALQSSSYLRLSKLMAWFTGNIGYHHVHHLNVRIPFYRLPEAMASIPALRSPIVTTLSLSAIRDCFNSCLWDERLQRMVSYSEAAKPMPAVAR